MRSSLAEIRLNRAVRATESLQFARAFVLPRPAKRDGSGLCAASSMVCALCAVTPRPMAGRRGLG